jgi:hypothetical protein
MVTSSMLCVVLSQVRPTTSSSVSRTLTFNLVRFPSRRSLSSNRFVVNLSLSVFLRTFRLLIPKASFFVGSRRRMTQLRARSLPMPTTGPWHVRPVMLPSSSRIVPSPVPVPGFVFLTLEATHTIPMVSVFFASPPTALRHPLQASLPMTFRPSRRAVFSSVPTIRRPSLVSLLVIAPSLSNYRRMATA